MSTSFEWNPEVLYAHAGETLEKHLSAVARRTQELVQQALAGPLFPRLAYLAGFCHDLGKATQDFQDYLNCSVNGKKWRSDPLLKSHSKIGTQFCLAIGEIWLAKKPPENVESAMYLWMAALAIRSHHGPLQDFIPDAFQINDLDEAEDFELISQQLKRLRRPQFDQLVQTLQPEFDVEPQILIDILLDKDNWRRWRKFKRFHLDPLLRHDEHLKYWSFLKLIFGALLQADKEQNLKGRFERRAFPYEQTQTHVSRLQARNEIDSMRQQLFVQCTQYAEQVDLTGTHIHQLTLPTGAGKTYSGLQVASVLRKRLEASGKQPRIIYALPFISIIEQNFDVFSKVFGEKSGDLLLAHHHLANLDYRTHGDELDGVEAAFKIEGWESELIVTTFYQVFEALFGTANATNRKFSALQNAIVILDEPQALPMRFFPLIRTGFHTMINELGWHIVLMTATPPLLFEKNDPLCTQIVSDFQQIFTCFNRYCLIKRHQDIQTLPQLMQAIENEWQSGVRRILVVANTVGSSRAIYDEVKALGSREGITSSYLSTEVLPVHRREKIEAIGNDDPMIVVSTQLIEAGVDISLDVVFRDFAPLPSLIQSAGRCRRHDWQEGRGRVIVMKLLDDNGLPYARKIYDSLMLDRTDEILAEVDEKDIWPFIQSYYERIQQDISQDTSKEMLRKLQKLELKHVAENFKLIDQQGGRRDMLTLFDSTARTLYDEWQTIGEQMRNGNVPYAHRFALKAERRKIWRKLASYLINPYEYRISKELRHRYPEGIIVIDQDIDKYYSEEFGLIPLEKGAEYAVGTNFDW